MNKKLICIAKFVNSKNFNSFTDGCDRFKKDVIEECRKVLLKFF